MKRKIIIATLSLLGVFLVAGTITIASTTTNTTTPKIETTTQSENFRFNADDEDFRHCHDDNTSMQKRHQIHQNHHRNSEFSNN